MIWVAMKLLIELWNSQENNSETVTNENDKELSEERYIYIYIYISRRKTENYWWSKSNIIV